MDKVSQGHNLGMSLYEQKCQLMLVSKPFPDTSEVITWFNGQTYARQFFQCRCHQVWKGNFIFPAK